MGLQHQLYSLVPVLLRGLCRKGLLKPRSYPTLYVSSGGPPRSGASQCVPSQRRIRVFEIIAGPLKVELEVPDLVLRVASRALIHLQRDVPVQIPSQLGRDDRRYIGITYRISGS